VGCNALDRLGYVSELFHAVGAQRLHVLQRANRLVHNGAFAGEELEVQSHRREGQQQVGEYDGCVHAETLGRGDGDFSGDLRRAADLQQRVVLAHCHVFRHVASCLAQEPDGRAIDRLAKAGTNEAAAAFRMRWIGCGFEQGNSGSCSSA